MITSPVKTQGRKTRLVPWLSGFTDWYGGGKWIEPFMGSCQVVLAFAPSDGALTCDDNPHLVRLCADMRDGTVSRESVKAFMEKEGKSLRAGGKAHFIKVRNRFNRSHDPHDLLFLSHAGFNGLMRWSASENFSSYGQNDRKFNENFMAVLRERVWGVPPEFADMGVCLPGLARDVDGSRASRSPFKCKSVPPFQRLAEYARHGTHLRPRPPRTKNCRIPSHETARRLAAPVVLMPSRRTRKTPTSQSRTGTALPRCADAHASPVSVSFSAITCSRVALT